MLKLTIRQHLSAILFIAIGVSCIPTVILAKSINIADEAVLLMLENEVEPSAEGTNPEDFDKERYIDASEDIPIDSAENLDENQRTEESGGSDCDGVIDDSFGGDEIESAGNDELYEGAVPAEDPESESCPDGGQPEAGVEEDSIEDSEIEDSEMKAMADDLVWNASGSCEWSIDDKGVLTIRPQNGREGTLGSWTHTGPPWKPQKDRITSVQFSGIVHAQTCIWMFFDCARLTSLDFTGFDTSSVTAMVYMFCRCPKLVSLDLSGFNTSSVTEMSYMFYECKSLESLDISGWDMSSVKQVSSMFCDCESLASLDVSGWVTSSMTSLSSLFGGCASLAALDVSGWDTSSVRYFSSAFSGCKSLTALDVSGWKTSSATDMAAVFSGCSGIASLDVSGWDTSSVTRMTSMFDGCSSLEHLDASSWDTYLLGDTSSMFYRCSSLASLDASGWDTSIVKSMTRMFDGCSSLETVTLGEGFTFCGIGDSRIGSLPEGMWKSSLDNTVYTAGTIPDHRADTYHRLMNPQLSLKVDGPQHLTYSLSATTLYGGVTCDHQGEGQLVYTNSSVGVPESFSIDPSSGNITVPAKTPAGTYGVSISVTLSETDRYTSASATTSLAIQIDPASISDATVSDVASCTYAASSVNPSPEVTFGGEKLVEGTDYTLSYENNVNAGTATITITGKSNYTGTQSIAFSITARSIAEVTIAEIDDVAYSGNPAKPAVTVQWGGKTLKSGADYTLSYSNNVEIGTATITVTGNGNYRGTKKATFSIVVADMENATVTAIANQTYTGSAIKPVPTVKVGGRTLKAGTDYTLAYANNTRVGTATITITGKGNYTGTKKVTFKVVAASVASATVSTAADKTYTGSAIKPVPTVKVGGRTLKAGTDYTLAYANNTRVGTATITITGKGNYKGIKRATFKVVAAPISKATVAKVADQRWTGKAITPSPKVTFNGKVLAKGTDYTLSYKDNTDAGTATITITGKGNFTGTRSVTFKITGPAIKEFPDVPKSHWAHDAIGRAAALGFLSGYSNGNFGPSDPITRGQICVMLWKVAGSPAPASGAKSFPDVKPTAYYYKAVSWASAAGVVNGYSNGTFGPDDQITREQLCVMAASYATKVAGKKATGSASDYASMPDASKVSSYARPAVGWAYRNGVLPIRTGKLDPQAKADRAQAAWVIVGTYDFVAK